MEKFDRRIWSSESDGSRVSIGKCETGLVEKQFGNCEQKDKSILSHTAKLRKKWKDCVYGQYADEVIFRFLSRLSPTSLNPYQGPSLTEAD